MDCVIILNGNCSADWVKSGDLVAYNFLCFTLVNFRNNTPFDIYYIYPDLFFLPMYPGFNEHPSGSGTDLPSVPVGQATASMVVVK